MATVHPRGSLCLLLLCLLFLFPVQLTALQILAKSKIERCDRSSAQDLQCNEKLVIDVAVPSDSSGREASIVAEVVETENTSNGKAQTIKESPVITIKKSAVYAVYEISYVRDVAYKPEELYVHTRKCEPEAGPNVVGGCARLQDGNGHIIEQTEPVCCSCGPNARVPHKCGSPFAAIIKGKANTAHCLRFPGDWFHVFGVGKWSLGFTIQVEVKTQSRKSEVVLGPEKKTVVSSDNLLRANLVGDYVGYTSIPSFENFYLVTPRERNSVQPDTLGQNYSMWMLLERVRFTLDGTECNKIGVSYEAFKRQPDFCRSPFWSCLHNQLWNFWESDSSRIKRRQPPQFRVEKRFERINQHPNAGSHSFSIGINEVLSTNLLIELNADDVQYVVHRSPGDILNISIPTFEALAQFGIATIISKNTGNLEASYSLVFDCSGGINKMEEQVFIMRPGEISGRTFELRPATSKATKYDCKAILKDSDFKEVDRAECQFTTIGTVIDTGTQIPSETNSDEKGILGEFKSLWRSFWDNLVGFLTGKTCRKSCSGFFDFGCHMQYVCISWIVMFGLFLAIFPIAVVLLWLLHQNGLFDPLYDWWDDSFGSGNQKNGTKGKHEKNDYRKHTDDMHHKQKVKQRHGTMKSRVQPHRQKGKDYCFDTKQKQPQHHRRKNHHGHHELEVSHRHRHHHDATGYPHHHRHDNGHDHILGRVIKHENQREFGRLQGSRVVKFDPSQVHPTERKRTM
ncbi:unnamed protein product [Victoria cruziana]